MADGVQRMGVVFPDRSRPLRAQRELIGQLEAWGYTDLWAGESDGYDAFVPLATVAAWGTGLRLGTAVVSPFLHPPALLAMQAASLASVASGGFVLGIGASSAAIVQRWNGVAFDKPLGRVRDAAEQVRRLMAGGRHNGFALHDTPVTPVPVYLAALGPTMLRTAAQSGDGVILTCVGADDIARIISHCAPGHEVVAWITVCPSEDADLVRAVARRRLAGYLAAPAYQAQQRWLGRGELLAPVFDAWATNAGYAAAAAALPDDVVDALVVHGSVERCHEQLDRFSAAGVTTPLLEVLPGVIDAAEALAMLAPATRASTKRQVRARQE